MAKIQFSNVFYFDHKKDNTTVEVMVNEVLGVKGEQLQANPLLTKGRKAYEFCVVKNTKEQKGIIGDLFIVFPSLSRKTAKSRLSEAIRKQWQYGEPTWNTVREFVENILQLIEVYEKR